VSELRLDGGGVDAGDSDERDVVSVEGGDVCDGSAGKVVVTPLTTAETRPSGDWPRISTPSPCSVKGNPTLK
jgi:hypothetical protein